MSIYRFSDRFSLYTQPDGYKYFNLSDLENNFNAFLSLSQKYWDDDDWTEWLYYGKLYNNKPTKNELLEIRDIMCAKDELKRSSRNGLPLSASLRDPLVFVVKDGDDIDGEVVEFYINNAGKLRIVYEDLNGDEFYGDWDWAELVPMSEVNSWRYDR